MAAEGFDLAKKKALEVLDNMAVAKIDRDDLINVARTSLRTKVKAKVADLLTEIVVDAVLAIKKPNEAIDLHMVEVRNNCLISVFCKIILLVNMM